MKRIATLLCLGGILLTGAASAQITPQSLTAWSDDSSTLHPAALALREWRRLDLTEEQVTRIREIEVELSRSFMPFLQRIRADRDRPDPGIWWGEVEVDEEEVRRVLLQELLPGPGGTVWVREHELWEHDRPRWWVLDAETGALVGYVAMPPGLEVHEIGPGWVLGVYRDDLGVAYVRQYGMELEIP